MKNIRDRFLALVVLLPALFWLFIYIVLRNKSEVAYLTGFVSFLVSEIKGTKHTAPRRIYP